MCTPKEHVVSIIAALLLRLSGDAHARAIHKFVENDFEKLDIPVKQEKSRGKPLSDKHHAAIIRRLHSFASGCCHTPQF